MSSTEINTGIPTGYELTIDFDALHDRALQKNIETAARMAIIGTAGDPEIAIAIAATDGMGHN